MLLLIGDQFDGDLSTFINGAVVSLRIKGDRLAVWLKKIDDVNTIKTIGKKIKDLLNLPPINHIVYEVRRILGAWFQWSFLLSVSRSEVRWIQQRNSTLCLRSSIIHLAGSIIHSCPSSSSSWLLMFIYSLHHSSFFSLRFVFSSSATEHRSSTTDCS